MKYSVTNGLSKYVEMFQWSAVSSLIGIEAVNIVYTVIVAWQYVLSAYVLKYKEKWKRKYNHLWVIKDSVRPTSFANNKLNLSWKIKYLI